MNNSRSSSYVYLKYAKQNFSLNQVWWYLSSYAKSNLNAIYNNSKQKYSNNFFLSYSTEQFAIQNPVARLFRFVHYRTWLILIGFYWLFFQFDFRYLPKDQLFVHVKHQCFEQFAISDIITISKWMHCSVLWYTSKLLVLIKIKGGGQWESWVYLIRHTQNE